MYQLLAEPGYVLRVADTMTIPCVAGNPLFHDYEAWLAQGNTPRPAVLPPSPATTVPASISDRQFFQQLAVDGIITRAEALAAVKTGDVPAALAGIVDALPEADRFGAEMLLSGATVFERTHPLSIAIGKARGMTPSDIDAFFRAAAAL